MKTFLPSLTVLAFAAAVQSAEPPSQDTAAKVAVALALAQRQAATTPTQERCENCDVRTGSGCTCDENCQCVPQWSGVGMPCPGAGKSNPPPVLLHKAATPKLSITVISRRDCVPCLKLAAELRANGKTDDFPNWDIYTDRPDLEYDYGITAFPTILLFENTKVISRHVGYMSAADLLHWVQNPDEPQSRGENMGVSDVGMVGNSWSGDRVVSDPVLHQFYGVASQPAYRPQMAFQPMMRFSASGGCST